MAQNTLSPQLNKTAGQFHWIILLLITLMTGGWQPLWGQDSTAVAEEKEDASIKTKVSLAGSQFPDGSILLSALLRSKVEGSYQKTPNQKILFSV